MRPLTGAPRGLLFTPTFSYSSHLLPSLPPSSPPLIHLSSPSYTSSSSSSSRQSQAHTFDEPLSCLSRPLGAFCQRKQGKAVAEE